MPPRQRPPRPSRATAGPATRSRQTRQAAPTVSQHQQHHQQQQQQQQSVPPPPNAPTSHLATATVPPSRKRKIEEDPDTSISPGPGPSHTNPPKRARMKEPTKDDSSPEQEVGVGAMSPDEGFEHGTAVTPSSTTQKHSSTRRTHQKNHGHSLACPFYSYDPIANRECRTFLLTKISYVKQHISRHHQQTPCCPVCFEEFDDDEGVRRHLRRQICETKEAQQPNGVTEEQLKRLRGRVDQKKSVEEQWYDIFRILYPDKPLPKTVYVDHDISPDVGEFVGYMLHRLGSLVPRIVGIAAQAAQVPPPPVLPASQGPRHMHPLPPTHPTTNGSHASLTRSPQQLYTAGEVTFTGPFIDNPPSTGTATIDIACLNSRLEQETRRMFHAWCYLKKRDAESTRQTHNARIRQSKRRQARQKKSGGEDGDSSFSPENGDSPLSDIDEDLEDDDENVHDDLERGKMSKGKERERDSPVPPPREINFDDQWLVVPFKEKEPANEEEKRRRDQLERIEHIRQIQELYTQRYAGRPAITTAGPSAPPVAIPRYHPAPYSNIPPQPGAPHGHPQPNMHAAPPFSTQASLGLPSGFTPLNGYTSASRRGSLSTLHAYASVQSSPRPSVVSPAGRTDSPVFQIPPTSHDRSPLLPPLPTQYQAASSVSRRLEPVEEEHANKLSSAGSKQMAIETLLAPREED